MPQPIRIPTPPPTPPRSIWQRQSDKDAQSGTSISGYNQGADVFTRTPPAHGAGSAQQGYALVAGLVSAIDKLAKVNK